jgi:hypothetical protein
MTSASRWEADVEVDVHYAQNRNSDACGSGLSKVTKRSEGAGTTGGDGGDVLW